MAITAAQLNVVISATGAAQTKAEIAGVGDAVAGANRGIAGTAANLTTLGRGLLGLGAAIVGPLALGEKTAIAFGRAMGNVNSIAQVSQEQLAGISTQVEGIAVATGRGPTELATALYNVYSVGFKGADAMQILKVAALDANAGLSDTATTTGVLTSALNAFGVGADQAQKYSDVLFQEVNDGANTFDQLAGSLGRSMPIASALGVNIQELGAAYAIMTDKGLSASETETDVASLMRAGIKPSKEMTAQLQAHGYATAQDLIAQKGFGGYLDFLNSVIGNNTTEMGKMLPNVRAMVAYTDLAGNGTAAFTKELDRMNHASDNGGATLAAFKEQMQTTAFHLQELSAAFQVVQIRIGAAFAPAINAASDALRGLFEWFISLPSGIQQVIAIITGLTGALSLFTGAGLLAAAQIAKIVSAVEDLAGVESLGELFAPLAAAAPEIALVIAALAALYLAYQTNFLGFADLVNGIGDLISSGITGVENFAKHFKAAWDGLDQGPSDVMRKINEWGGIADNATRQLNPLIRGLMALSAAFRAIGGDHTPAIFVAIAAGLDQLTIGLEQVIAAVQTLKAAFDTGGLAGVLGLVAAQVTSLRGTLVPLIAAWADVKLGIDHVITGIRDLLAGDVAGAFRQWRIAVTDLRFAWDSFTQSVHALGTLAVRIGGWAISAAEDLGKDVWDWVQYTAWPAVQSAARDVGTLAVTIAGWTEGKIPSIVDWLKTNLFARAINAAFDLGTLAVNIAGWAEGKIPSLVDWLKAHVFALAVNAALDLGSLLVNVAGWAQGTIPSIVDWLKATVFARAVNAVFDAGTLIVNVAGWAEGKIADLGGWLKAQLLARAVNAAVDLGTLTVNIAAWAAGKIPSIVEWIKANVLSTGINAAVDLGNLTVNVAGWVEGKIASITDWIKTNVLTKGINAAVDLGTLTVNVAAWAEGTIPSIVAWIKANVLSTGATAAVDLGTIAVNVAGWTEGKIADLGIWLRAHWLGVAMAAVDLGTLTVNIAGWVAGKMADLGAFVRAHAAAVAIGLTVQLSGIALSILSWAVTIVADTAKSIHDAITSPFVLLDAWTLITGVPDVIIGLGIGALIGAAIGHVIVTLSDVLVEVTTPSVVYKGAEILGLIMLAVLGAIGVSLLAGILLPALAVTLPFLLIAGAVIGAIALMYFVTTWVADYFKKNPMDVVKIAVNISLIMGNIKDDFDKAKAYVTDFGTAGKQAGDAFKDAKSYVTDFGTAGKQAGDAFKDAKSYVTDFGTAGKQASDAMMWLAATLVDINFYLTDFGSFGDDIKAVGNAFKDAKNYVTDFGTAASDIETTFNAIKGVVTGFADAVTSAFKDALGPIVDFTNGLIAAYNATTKITGATKIDPIGKDAPKTANDLAGGINNLASAQTKLDTAYRATTQQVANATEQAGNYGKALNRSMPAVNASVEAVTNQMRGLTRLSVLYPSVSASLATTTSASAAYKAAANDVWGAMMGQADAAKRVGTSQQQLAIAMNDSSIAADTSDASLRLVNLAARDATKTFAAAAPGARAMGTSLVGLDAPARSTTTAFTRFGQTVTSSLSGVARAATTSLAPLPGRIAAIAASVTGAALPAFARLATGVGTSLAGVARGATSALGPLPGIIGGVARAAVGTAVPAFAALAAGASANFARVPAAAATHFGALVASVASHTAQAAATAAANTAGMAASVGTNAASMAAQAIAGATSANSGVSAQMIGMAAVAAAQSAVMAAIVGANAAAMASAGVAGGSGFALGILAGMALAVGAASAGVGAVVAICSGVDLFGPGFATGSSFSAGVASGILSNLGAVQSAASQIVSAAAAAAAATAMIHSPSLLFRRLGAYVPEGFALGIKDGFSTVKNAASAMVHVPALPAYHGAYAANAAAGPTIIISPTIHAHVTGSTGADASEVAAQVAEKIGPVLVHVATRIRRGQGAPR